MHTEFCRDAGLHTVSIILRLEVWGWGCGGGREGGCPSCDLNLQPLSPMPRIITTQPQPPPCSWFSTVPCQCGPQSVQLPRHPGQRAVHSPGWSACQSEWIASGPELAACLPVTNQQAISVHCISIDSMCSSLTALTNSCEGLGPALAACLLVTS